MPYYEKQGVRWSIQAKVKHDLTITNNSISFSGLAPEKDYAFVITNQGELKIGEKETGMHYVLAEGQKYIKAAGILKLNQWSKITEVVNNSGHYQPLPSDNDQVFEAFRIACLLAPNARKINIDFEQHPYGSY